MRNQIHPNRRQPDSYRHGTAASTTGGQGAQWNAWRGERRNVRPDLLAELDGHRGVLSRGHALTLVPRHIVDDALRSGAITAVFRGVYCAAERQADRDIRRRAALLAVPGAALSHTDALAVVRLITDSATSGDDVHLTIGAGARRPGRQPGLQVHRRTAFQPLRLTTGHAVIEPHQAVVDSWRLLGDEVRRAMLVDAVRDGLLSTARLRRALAPNTAGAAAMRSMLDLLDAGCQSELEIFGLTRVFSHPSLPRSTAQFRVRLRDRVVVLDRAYDDVLVGVELDGAAYHFGKPQRERDMRRDAALAALGWIVLRFSYRRIVDDPEGVRQEIAAVIATRRSQLGRALGS